MLHLSVPLHLFAFVCAYNLCGTKEVVLIDFLLLVTSNDKFFLTLLLNPLKIIKQYCLLIETFIYLKVTIKNVIKHEIFF